MAKLGSSLPGTERVFTVELDSGSDLKRVSIPNGPRRMLVEGTIGILKHVEFLEGIVLEVIGTKGVLRIDLTMGDLAKIQGQRR